VIAVVVLSTGRGSMYGDAAMVTGEDNVLAADAVTVTTTWKLADSPTAIVVFEATTSPVPPTAGVVRVHPAGPLADTNVVPAASVCLTVTAGAGENPPLDTETV
jgi:hypothetical protein